MYYLGTLESESSVKLSINGRKVVKIAILYHLRSDKKAKHLDESIKKLSLNEMIENEIVLGKNIELENIDGNVFNVNESSISKLLLCEKSIHDVHVDDIVTKVFIKDSFQSDSAGGAVWEFLNSKGINGDDYDLYDIEENEELHKEFFKWFGNYMFDEYENVIDKLEDSIDQSGEITIYREMRVIDNWMEHLIKQGKHLGIYWTWDENSAEAHWGKVKNRNKALLVAKIKEEYVNWEETIKLNMELSLGDMEREIRLFKGTTIDLISVIINGEEQDLSTLKNKEFLA